ncbi:MAG: S16 family serine protease [archaeon]
MRLAYILMVLVLVCPVAAVNVAAIDNKRNGVVLQVEAEIVPGKGRVLIASAPFAGIDTQYSGRIAAEAALNYTGQELGMRDIIYTFYANATTVEGGSAGAAMALETIAKLQGRRIRDDIIMTGGIGEDGKVLQVSGILEKLYPSKGYGLFIVPAGQLGVEAVAPFVREDDGKPVLVEEKVVIDIERYARQHWGLEVVEVGTIGELAKIAFAPEPYRPREATKISLEPREIGKGEEPLASVAREFAEEARGIAAGMPEGEDRQLIEDNIASAEKYLGMGYPYSAANRAFKALIDARTYGGEEFGTGELKERVRLKAEALEMPAGYSEPLPMLVAGRERYSWTLSEIWIQRLSGTEDAAGLEAADGWLDISARFLDNVGGERVEFSSQLAHLAEMRLEEAKEEIAADFVLNQDPYDSTHIASAAEYDRRQGWYYEMGYDAINAKARAFCIGDGKEMDEDAKRRVAEAEGYVSAAMEKGLGFWAEQYLGEAKIAFFENNTREACAFGLMAKEYAEFDLEANGYVIEERARETVQVEKPLAVETQSFLRLIQNVLEFFGRQ